MRTQTPPAEILAAATVLLSKHCPDLTPARLQAALAATLEVPAPATMLHPTEAARRLGICRHTVSRMLAAGTLPGRKVGAQWRVCESAVRELAAGTRQGGAK